MRTCFLLVVAGFVGLEPLEHVIVVPAAGTIAPDESEAFGIATVCCVLGLCSSPPIPFFLSSRISTGLLFCRPLSSSGRSLRDETQCLVATGF